MLLRDKLSKNSILYSKFISLENNARHLLEYSQGGSHLQYTPHGLSHVTIVEDNYDWLLSEDIEKFSYTEIFILLSATYLDVYKRQNLCSADITQVREQTLLHLRYI